MASGVWCGSYFLVLIEQSNLPALDDNIEYMYIILYQSLLINTLHTLFVLSFFAIDSMKPMLKPTKVNGVLRVGRKMSAKK